jgi:hypothetical protein
MLAENSYGAENISFGSSSAKPQVRIAAAALAPSPFKFVVNRKEPELEPEPQFVAPIFLQ